MEVDKKPTDLGYGGYTRFEIELEVSLPAGISPPYVRSHANWRSSCNALPTRFI